MSHVNHPGVITSLEKANGLAWQRSRQEGRQHLVGSVQAKACACLGPKTEQHRPEVTLCPLLLQPLTHVVHRCTGIHALTRAPRHNHKRAPQYLRETISPTDLRKDTHRQLGLYAPSHTLLKHKTTLVGTVCFLVYTRLWQYTEGPRRLPS